MVGNVSFVNIEKWKLCIKQKMMLSLNEKKVIGFVVVMQQNSG